MNATQPHTTELPESRAATRILSPQPRPRRTPSPTLAIAGALVAFATSAVADTTTQPTEAPTRTPAANAPIHIPAGQVQLFVDDHLTSTSRDLRRTLHGPTKDDAGRTPLIAPPPGTETLMAKGSIVFDTRRKQYVMFAKSRPPTNIYRYVSDDALHWKPADSDTPTPIALDRTCPQTGQRVERDYLGMYCFFYDTTDDEFPYKGWIFFGNWGNEYEGAYYVRSRDGQHWQRRQRVIDGYAGPGDPTARTIHQDGRTVYGAGDTTRFGYDPTTGRFLAILKFFTTEPVRPDNQLRSRAYLFTDRLDAKIDLNRITHIALLPPADDDGINHAGDEYYESTAWRCGALWLGELLVWHKTGDYPYSAPGCSFIRLVVSRDGLNWHIVPFDNEQAQPGVFLHGGPEGGNHGRNDGGHMSLFSQGPLHVTNEWILYYGATSFGKNHDPGKASSGGGIFRARLRPDGLVSVDAGTLTTHPLRLDGRELYVNAVGPVRVDLLDDTGKPLANATVTGDAVRHPVRFGGHAIRDVLGDRPARLRFTVTPPARLYAWQVD
jgi:hypothetical protein